MIDCTNTLETVYQVLDPIPVIPPGGTKGQYLENGILTLNIGQNVYSVTFLTVKVSALYIFDEAVIRNTVDDPAPAFEFTISNQTTTGFQLLLDSKPVTANSAFVWAVRILT